MTTKQLYSSVLIYFKSTMPLATTELRFSSPYELLVAVMLSAQCTDKRVNLVTPELFRRFPTVRDLALAEPGDVLPLISSVSYPNSKALHLVEAARIIWRERGGEVPSDAEGLESLPGVGRKTANVVLSVAFGEARMPVDTHVFRVSRRLGLVPLARTSPLAVEKELTRNIPPELLSSAHHWLLLHGRYVCTARKPRCHECGLLCVCRRRGMG